METIEKRMPSQLFAFAYFSKFSESVAFLAENLVDNDEKWEFSDMPVSHYSILKNYLEHTFRKVKEEEKIAFTVGNQYACFNTGLITRNLETIYAFFEKNRLPSASSPYYFKAFLKESDSQLLRAFRGNYPEMANYFHHPEDLIFNPNCRIIPQWDHIIEDNLERFPAHMQSLSSTEIRCRLEGAIGEIQKRVRTNYKLAVPQYYKGRIQLLLPLRLTPGSPNPDLALAIHKVSPDAYTARTCLTLKMAYNNARLIVKPQSDWLKP